MSGLVVDFNRAAVRIAGAFAAAKLSLRVRACVFDQLSYRSRRYTRVHHQQTAVPCNKRDRNEVADRIVRKRFTHRRHTSHRRLVAQQKRVAVTRRFATSSGAIAPSAPGRLSITTAGPVFVTAPRR